MGSKYKVYQSILTGISHDKKEMLAQDRLAYDVRDGKYAISLVDGIGKTDLNIIAGEQISKLVCQFLIDEFDQIMKCKSKDQIKYSLINEIYKMIEYLCVQHRQLPKEFSSTLLAICIDEENNFCSVHVGDGIIAVYNNDGTMNPISYPINGNTLNETWLTTSEMIIDHMSILRGKIKEGDIILASDGIFRNGDSFHRMKDVYENLKQYGMIQDRKNDDQGMIVLHRRE